MATKTISLKGESFSEVVLRATWPEDTISASDFLELVGDRVLRFTEDELDQVEALKQHATPPGDKWAGR